MSAAAAIHVPRSGKGGCRTRAESRAIREGLYTILAAHHPMTVRQVFYQATTRGLVDKIEAEYKGIVVRFLGELRRNGTIPFEWIVDNTRRLDEPATWSTPRELLDAAARQFRMPMWDDTPATVYIFVEKDALAGELTLVTNDYDVPLGVVRGDPSITFLHDVAMRLEDDGRPAFIGYFGDHDPNGRDIDRVIERDLREWAPSVDLTFERVAVTEEQIVQLSLPTRPTKDSDSRAKNFQGDSVELDAIPPDELRTIARHYIERHVDQHQLKELRNIEAEARESLRQFAATWGEA